MPSCFFRVAPVRYAAIALIALFSSTRADFQGSSHMMPFDEDTIAYSQAAPAGEIARLQSQLEKGELQLDYEPAHGYLLSLLSALEVPVSSQMLVFSKTSFQRERISPSTPRALYFNDDVYIGYIPGSPMIEISTADPKLGGVFYTLKQVSTNKPAFVRTDQCLECHASSKTLGVPGHLVRSFITEENGSVDLITGISQVTHRTPLADRWGGWYVTGRHGGQIHRGNLAGIAAFERQKTDGNYRGNVTDLSPFFDVSRYPRAGSDIVALMVLEHQYHCHNFITRLNYAARLALEQYGHIRYLKSATDAFLKYLLFAEETPLTSPIAGDAEYRAWFESQGPRDARGRSLRQFDLETRLFRYPCSYLIYSEAFDALPEVLRTHLFERLDQILQGKDPSDAFDHLTPESRRAIREILLETKPALSESWMRQ